MRIARIKLKDGTLLVARGKYLCSGDLNQYLLEGIRIFLLFLLNHFFLLHILNKQEN